MSSYSFERSPAPSDDLERFDQADLLDRLTNQTRAIGALERLVALTQSTQDGLLTEVRATQLRHGELLREHSELLRRLVGLRAGSGADPVEPTDE